MANNIQRQLFQHLKHAYGATTAPLAHLLPADYFASVPDDFEIPFRMGENISLRENLMNAWLSVGQLKAIPEQITEYASLMDQLQGLLAGFDVRNDASRTGVSYAASAINSAAIENNELLPRFMNACAHWFQRELHSSGSVAWAEMASQWLEHFSIALSRYTQTLQDTYPDLFIEGDYVCFIRGNTGIDPELLRSSYALKTQKIVMVLQPESEHQRIAVYCSKRDRQQLLSNDNQPAHLTYSSQEGTFSIALPWSTEDIKVLQSQGDDPLLLYMDFGQSSHPLTTLIRDMDKHFSRSEILIEPMQVSMADLPAVQSIHRALQREDRRTHHLQIPLHLKLFPEQRYYCSLDHNQPAMVLLSEVLENPRYSFVTSCRLWSDLQQSACVDIQLSHLRTLHQQHATLYGRLLQERPGHFSLRAPSEPLSLKPWPTPGLSKQRQGLESYALLYNQSNQYIRDPLTPAAIRRSLQARGHAGIADTAMNALAMHMRRQGINTHFSFETRSDGATGSPYFVSMNIYRFMEGSAGLDCRSVSAFIKSHRGEPLFLSDHVIKNDGITNEDLQRLGMDSDEADALFEKAVSRATASHQHRFTSQWENATHQSRQLMPVLPLLMQKMAEQPAIDTLRLVRKHDLTSFPTYLVELPVTKTLKVRFDDAWGSELPMTLHGFLSTPNCYHLASADGQYLLQKRSHGYWLTDQVSKQSYELPFSADEMKVLSLKQAKTGMNYNNPSQSGALLDRAKISALLDLNAPPLEQEGRIQLPSFIAKDALMWSRINMLATTFAQWSLHADFKQPLDIQLRQLIEILPEHPALDIHQVLAGGMGAAEGRLFLETLHQTDPEFLGAMQYGFSGRNLFSIAQSQQGRVDPVDTAFTLQHLLRWNILQFHRQNKKRLNHYQQMPFMLKILTDIEPNTKQQPAELMRDVAKKYALPLSLVEQCYRMAYQDQKSDPLQKHYLPSKELTLPLMRELLARDMIVWHQLATRLQDREFYPGLEPLQHALKQEALQTDVQWWAEQYLHPALRLSNRSQSHRTEEVGILRLRIPVLDEHQQHIVLRTSAQISDDELQHQLLPVLSSAIEVLRLQNSLKNIHSYQQKDLTFPSTLRDQVLRHVISSITSSQAKTVLEHASSFVSQLGASACYVEDEGPVLKLFHTLALYSMGQDGLPGPVMITPEQHSKIRETLLSFYEHRMHKEIPEEQLKHIDKVLQQCTLRHAVRNWALGAQRSQANRYVLIDDTSSRTGALGTIYQEAQIPFERCSKQQLILTLLKSAGIEFPGETSLYLQLQLFVDSGEMPKHRTLAKQVLQDVFEVYREPKLFDLPGPIQQLADSMVLTVQDPCSAHRMFTLHYPELSASRLDTSMLKVKSPEPPAF